MHAHIVECVAYASKHMNEMFVCRPVIHGGLQMATGVWRLELFYGRDERENQPNNVLGNCPNAS